MPKFRVPVRYHGRTTVEVEAESREQAYDQVSAMESRGEMGIPSIDVEIEWPEEVVDDD